MIDDLPEGFDQEGATPEERERIAAVRAQAEAAGPLPEGVEVTFGFLDAAAQVNAIDAADAAVFLPAKGFVFKRLGTMPLLPTIELGHVDWMEDAAAKKLLRCDLFGIGREIEGVDVGLFAHLRLRVGLKRTPIYVMLDAAPEEWLRWAMRRFAIVLPNEAWIATGILQQHPDGVSVPGKLGRNDPCPCGSGRKAKRCCLA